MSKYIFAYHGGGSPETAEEGETGSLEVGKKADIVILSENLFDIETWEIPNVEIEMTYFEGKRVYQK